MRPATRMAQPALPPGICYRCRVSEHAGREYFVDTGISLDWEGVIYFCDKCLEDLAKCTGEFFTKPEVDDLLSIQTEMVEKAQKLVEYHEKFTVWLSTFGFDLSGAKTIFDSLIEEENERGRIPAEYTSEADGSIGETDESDSVDSGEIDGGEAAEGFVLKL